MCSSFEQKKLQLERDKLLLDEKKFRADKSLWRRNFSNVLVPLVVAGASWYIAQTQIAIADRNQTIERQIKVGDFVASHEHEIFSDNPDTHRRMVAIIKASFEPRISGPILAVIESLAPISQKPRYRDAIAEQQSATRLLNSPRNASLINTSNPAYAKMSLALQDRLKKEMYTVYFSERTHFLEQSSMLALVVYASLPPTISNDIYWDQGSDAVVQAMLNDPRTIRSFSAKIEQIKPIVKNTPAQIDEEFDPRSYLAHLPSLEMYTLRHLIGFEYMVIDAARDLGIQMARMKKGVRMEDILLELHDSNAAQSYYDAWFSRKYQYGDLDVIKIIDDAVAEIFRK